jgi:hypothetical protein
MPTEKEFKHKENKLQSHLVRNPMQTFGFSIQWFRSQQKPGFLALNHHHTWTLMKKSNMSIEIIVSLKTLLFLAFQIDQIEVTQIACKQFLIFLQKPWAPQNWESTEIALSGVTHVIPNQEMIPRQTAPATGQFRKRWWPLNSIATIWA